MIRKFNTKIAKLYGINAAIVAQFIWDNLCNETDITYECEAVIWCRCSVKMFTASMPFMTRSMVERAVRILDDAGVIKKACFNANHFDHTNWYTFTDYGCQLND